MTPKKIQQFNRMLATLRRISKDYKTPDQIRRNQETPFDASEEIEMAYENIQEEARVGCKGISFIKTEVKERAPRPGLNTDSMLDHGAY